MPSGKGLNTVHQKLFPGASRLLDSTCPFEDACGFSPVQSDLAMLVDEAITGDSVLIFGNDQDRRYAGVDKEQQSRNRHPCSASPRWNSGFWESCVYNSPHEPPFD
jgi:hypothetical protein